MQKPLSEKTDTASFRVGDEETSHSLEKTFTKWKEFWNEF